MDIDINSILNFFTKNFVPEDIRERSALQLKDDKERVKFTDRLNHQWDTLLDMKYLTEIPFGATEREFVIENLNIKKNELWYIISNNDDIDGKIAEFNVAFNMVYGRGFGSLIVDRSGEKLYLETALIQGKQNRFIGKLK